MELEDIYTQIIIEQSNSKKNKRRLENPTIVLEGKNPSCGDEIKLELVIKDGVVADASFTGVGCAISQASTSLMIDLVKGKPIETAMELSDLFIRMIQRKTVNESELEPLEDAVALMNISNMPARVKCATMPWHTLTQALK
ncbi:MAG: SUF system NifU family Fe-S cluster assembly protein [Anaerolineaceae bacterium]|nr:MAG: SUF system NifU family Fe-S cluster assembly protein [Anaerolineaceae bacterium]